MFVKHFPPLLKQLEAAKIDQRVLARRATLYIVYLLLLTQCFSSKLG